MESFETEPGHRQQGFSSASEQVAHMKIPHRARSSQRFVYEAQVQVIKKQVGTLDEICARLGLSQRKLAQLLMVDPSAMTRWSRSGEDAPPHIWRALQWYLGLNEKIPGLTPQYFLSHNTFSKSPEESIGWKRKISSELDEAHSTILALQSQTLGLQKKLRIYAALGGASLVLSTLLTILMYVSR